MLDIRNLPNCQEDVRQAGLDTDPGQPEPLPFHALRGRLQAVQPRISPLYRQMIFDPYVQNLSQLTESQFNQILSEDRRREATAGLMLDIAQAILQRGESLLSDATAAFQEVVSDLYDGFLSKEDRLGIEPPDFEIVPPLVKFGAPKFGPYTWPVSATRIFGCRAAIVSLPPANARRGLLAWSALSHEAAGHDVLHADDGLISEVKNAVRRVLQADVSARDLADYWASRIDETASDVLGILNMGPAAGIGLIGYFRGLNAAAGGLGKLRNIGPVDDPHPADIVRGFLAAATVRLLSFSEATDWADLIDAETNRDVSAIRLDGLSVTPEVAKKSAEIVARAIVTQPMASLENHAFGQIQNWRDTDEAIVRRLRALLPTANPLTDDLRDGIFAAHLVAAATISALAQDADVSLLFARMIALLKAMHERNPSFGPLLVRHPGDITRDPVYLPHEGEAA